MNNIKRITDGDIIELSAERERPCFTESGECYIVTRVSIYDDGERYEIEDIRDVNVFATEREAREWAAKMLLSKDDSCSVVKHTYTVRCNNVF